MVQIQQLKYYFHSTALEENAGTKLQATSEQSLGRRVKFVEVKVHMIDAIFPPIYKL